MNKIKSRHIWILVVLLMVLFDGGYAKGTPFSSTGYGFTLYYYNKDHLGNNREVLTYSGNVQQLTNYYPFGGIFADEGTGSSLQPYKYNGKELDRMHGLDLYDYGARHYDAVVPMFTQIDPLAEKYYSTSPYAYCHDNPTNTVDPDGKDDYILNIDGYLELWRKTNATATDNIFSSDKQSNITVKKNITKQLMTDRDDYNGNYASGGAEMQDLFKFCADNSSVEWRLNSYKTPQGEKEILMTSHDSERVSAQNNIGGQEEKNLNFTVHSHPDKMYSVPSGFKKNESWIDKNGYLNMPPGDKLTAWKISQRFLGKGMRVPKFYMYHPSTQTLVRYDRNQIKERKVIKDGKLHF